jgi:nucleoid-associated protein YgaU
MGYYRNEPKEKAYNKFSEKEGAILNADVELAPHEEYSRDNVYKLEGLGSMFNGTYRFKKVVHTISPSGYTVNAQARMVYDSKGNFVEGGYKTAPKPKKPKAPVKTRNDLTYVVRSGDTLWGIASRKCKSPLDWKAIEKANHAKLVARDSRNASDTGHWIYPSQKLIIPGHLLK